MAYNYGADANAIVQDTFGNVIANAQFTIWDAATSGTQITNLQDATGTPIAGGVVTSDTRGRLVFSDPTNTYLLVWAQSVSVPGDPRIAVMSRDVGPALQALIAAGATAIPLSQKGAASGVATLDAGSKIPIGQIPAAVVIDTEINVPSGVAGLDGASKISPTVQPDVDASPYLRQRQGVWDLERERVVRALSATDYTLTVTAILADAGFKDGDIIEVRNGTYPLLTKMTLTKPVTLRGKGSLQSVFTTAANIRMIEVTASKVTVESIGLTGPGSATYNSGSFGVYAVGASAASPITGFTIRRCRIASIAANAIQSEFVNDVTVEYNTITSIVRAGYMALSGDNCRFNRNLFDTATNGTGNPSSNGYAVAFSRNTTVDLATQPRCTNFEAKSNWVKNIPHWEGIDTHGGMFGVIEGNFLYNCDKPLAVVSSAGAVIASEFAPHYVSVRDNHMDSTVTDGSRGVGITVDGAGTGAAGSFAELSRGIVISGNTVIGHGKENTSTSGGLVLTYSVGAKVSDNLFMECSPSAIAVSSDVWGASFTGNVFLDTWTFNVSGVLANPAIVFHAANGSATVTGNIIVSGNKSVTPPAIKNTRGIRIGNITNNSIVQFTGNNFSAATTAIQDLGPTSKMIIPYDRVNVLVGEAALSGNVTVGPGAVLSTYTDLAGATVTFTTKTNNVRVLVNITLAGSVTTAQAGSRILCRLVVDGTGEGEVAAVLGTQINSSSGSQTYLVTLVAPGTHTLKLQAQHNAGGAGTIQGLVLATDTKFTYMALDA